MFLLLLFTFTIAWDPQPDGYELLPVPLGLDESNVTQWATKWTQWKSCEWELIHYAPQDACTGYNQPNLQWTQQSFTQTQLMMHDRYLYDRQSNQYTVSRYMNDVIQRYGGLDNVLLWPSYPNSGIDDRNQFDWFRDLPGGMEQLKQVIAEFHSYGVKVFLPYNPWDTATRPEVGYEDAIRSIEMDIHTLYKFIDQLHADGINGDTWYGVPSTFYNCSNPVAICPEGGLPSAYLSHNIMSWGYWFWNKERGYPPVSRTKYLDSRHMVIVNARWALDRIPEIQSAFFNGVGYATWENVWGIYNSMSERSDAAVKSIYTILRRFSKAIVSPLWEPYSPTLFPETVFSTKFPLPSESLILWTVISIKDDDLPASEHSLIVFTGKSSEYYSRKYAYYDVYHGCAIEPLCKEYKDNLQCTVGFAIEKDGFGAVMQFIKGREPKDFSDFLKQMEELTRAPLSTLSNEMVMLQQTMINPTSGPVLGFSTSGMTLINGMSNWLFQVRGVQIEPVALWTPNIHDYGVGVQFPWETRPWSNHSHFMDISDFYIDNYPVTNYQYREFLKESHYTPNDCTNFLKHWDQRHGDPHTWNYPPGYANKPVIWVAVEDARAYASFYRKRLPHDWEWQYAASGGHLNEQYPWGNDWKPENMPQINRNRILSPPEDVGNYIQGCRDATICDMVGLIWQMTDQFCDSRTCGLLLRGGSYHRLTTEFEKNWYFPQAYQNQQHGKFLMMSESYDRSGTIGFRCVADA